MFNRIVPPRQELRWLDRPLSESEELLIRFLDEHLPEEWEIYVRPFCNGLVPDVVILHEQHGAQLFLVSDQDILQKVSQQSTQESDQRIGQSPAGQYGNAASLSYPGFRSGETNPIIFALPLRNRILEGYLPELGDAFDWERGAYDAIPVSVFFAKNSFSQINDAVEKMEYGFKPIMFGYDFLTAKHLRTIIPNLVKSIGIPNRAANKRVWTQFRQFLNPPYHSRNDGVEVSLTAKFKAMAKPIPGHRRVQGVAGSGKSFLIAHRAAALANEKLKVLVVCYNITLRNYLTDLIEKCPIDFSWSYIRVVHFHQFIFDEAASLGITLNAKKEREISLLIEKINNRLRSYAHGLYDAILIDEGQDFHVAWYKFLCRYLNQRNELLLVADRQQNIYGQDSKWTDGAMEGVQFRGPWAQLDAKSIRIPNALADKLNEFARQYLDKSDAEMLESHELDLFEQSHMIWEELNDIGQVHNRCLILYRAFVAAGVNPSDIVFLVPDHRIGLGVVRVLESSGISVNHLFSESQDTTRKHRFVMNDPRVKASTIHSFKGWELRCVILILANNLDNMPNAPSLVYTGMSRSQQNLCVLNLSSRFRGFGEKWERFEELERTLMRP